MNFNESHRIFYCLILIMLFGCSSVTPSGPTIAVMPAPGKPFDVFQLEDRLCRQFALESIGKSPTKAKEHAVGTAAAGTAIGAAAGAIMGGGQGAATGAGVGLIGGSMVGAGQGGSEGRDIQWSYDTAYSQCMYSKGNQVPGYPMQPQVSPPPREERKK